MEVIHVTHVTPLVKAVQDLAQIAQTALTIFNKIQISVILNVEEVDGAIPKTDA